MNILLLFGFTKLFEKRKAKRNEIEYQSIVAEQLKNEEYAALLKENDKWDKIANLG